MSIIEPITLLSLSGHRRSKQSEVGCVIIGIFIILEKKNSEG